MNVRGCDLARRTAPSTVGAVIAACASALFLIGGFLLVSTGMLTLDTGWGRRTRSLGPLVVRIAAPRELVFDMAALPYRPEGVPRAFRQKVEVLERGADMVLAAHRTTVGWVTTVTVETVTFRPPERIAFRLLRGPVPSVTEQFVLHDREDGAATELEYSGVLGTDGWALGAAWGGLVARHWERTVAQSLAGLKDAAESAAASRGAARG